MNRYDNFTPEISEDSYNDLKKRRVELPSEADTVNDTNNVGKTRVRRAKPVKAKARKEPSGGFSERILSFAHSPVTKGIVGLFVACFGFYLLISFISFISTGIADQSLVEHTAQGSLPPVDNAGGEGGARISDFLINGCFGVGSFVIIFWLFSIALKLLVGRPRFKTVDFTIKCLIALIAISVLGGLMTIASGTLYDWGGAHGRVVNEFIIGYLGWPGAIILCVFLLGVFVVLCLNDLIKWIIKIRKRRKAAKQAELEAIAQKEEVERMKANMTDLEDANSESEDEADTEATSQSLEFGQDMADFTSYVLEDDEFSSISESNEIKDDFEGAPEENDDIVSQDKVEVTEVDSMKVHVNTIAQVVDEDDSPDMYDPTAELSHYKFPPYSLLRESKQQVSVDQTEQSENQERIRKTLLDFGIPITDIKATVGPTVTLYEIVPDKGVKIARIRNLVDDIALSLAAHGVRIIAPIPGRGTVGIEVANKEPQTVSMRTVITSEKYQTSKYDLPIAIGSTISNEVYIADLAKMPHLLVAGATGQGKSVGLNAIITSLLYRKHPSELKFVLIDPKMVEFSLYSRLEKHYIAMLSGQEDPIITKSENVITTLNSLCVEMDNRYELLRMAGKRNIKEYNEKFVTRTLNPEKGHRYLPYIVVIVDEFSDLIMMAGREIEMPIARIAQKARAVGIHMIIATQRHSTNVITGIIRANFPARMAFKVSSGTESRIILDAMGAQQLIGRGDMLISNLSEMDRIQCAFIDTPEVEAICEFIEAQPGFMSPYILPEPKTEGGESDATMIAERDPLFIEAARLVVSSNTASASSLQRRYSIGYNRAGKIMDQLEASGIVGPAQGGKPRDVLVSPDQLERMLSNDV